MKPKIYANLHNHTTHSDGVYTPDEIVKIAKDEGYLAFATTDHDTVTGNSETRIACEKYGMETIFGCEFMAYSKEFDFEYHITAYDFDPEYPEMKEYLRQCSVTMTEKTREIFEYARENGLLTKEVTWQDVLDRNPGVTWFCNDHVFRTMKDMGLMTDKDYPPFLHDIFFKYWSMPKDAYEKLPIEELIPLIKRAGGIVLVAHPHEQLHRIPRLMELGIEGIEVWHPDLTQEEMNEALKIALENDLYISGGSDHSGLCGGQYSFYEDYTKCEYYIPECVMGTTKEFFDEIKYRKKNPNRVNIIKSYIE